MAVNKVVYGTTVLVDLTADTVTAATLMQGYTAHDASGAIITGTATGGGSDTDFANTIMRSGAITHIPDSVTKIGSNAFRDCTNLAISELPIGVTSIGNNAFFGCTNLALTELPNGVTSIGDSAFYSCTNLALTELPSGVTGIGADVFYSCKGLQQLDAQNVDTIGSRAFSSCSNLTKLVLRKSGTACTLKNVNAFNTTPMRGTGGKSGTVYVPSALISTYQTATNWSTLYSAGYLTFAAIEGSEYERD